MIRYHVPKRWLPNIPAKTPHIQLDKKNKKKKKKNSGMFAKKQNKYYLVPMPNTEFFFLHVSYL